MSTTRNVVGGRGRWDLPQAAVDWICGGLQYQVARTHTMVWQSGDVSHNPDLASYLEAGGNLKAECVLVRPGGQVEHHLFPQVPRHRLAAVHAEVVRFCRDEGVAFHEAGVVDGTLEASPAPSAMAPVARARGGGKQAAESHSKGDRRASQKLHRQRRHDARRWQQRRRRRRRRRRQVLRHLQAVAVEFERDFPGL